MNETNLIGLQQKCIKRNVLNLKVLIVNPQCLRKLRETFKGKLYITMKVFIALLTTLTVLCMVKY